MEEYIKPTIHKSKYDNNKTEKPYEYKVNDVKLNTDGIEKIAQMEQDLRNEEERVRQLKKSNLEMLLRNRKIFKGFTRKDLMLIHNDELLIQVDNRDFCVYMRDVIVLDHPLISLICFKSLMEPLPLRITHFFFTITLCFGLNALL